ncbi:VOC family protein [Cohnella sp. CFH 77786]|uniref:VOC family protein n=1 Tax=Cohnella sp. CFH 77786 TaxID=2662265 RepID=UPI001C60B69C|nr:VOC family protein [Cohnella sp. CFH 77786]
MLHHIELNVSNLKRSIEFWGPIFNELGYSIYQEWEYGISWISGNTYIVLVQTEDKYLDIPYHRKRVGMNHLAFHASSREQVNKITYQLESNGVPILYKDRHPYAGGSLHYAVFFEDPDRIKVEIVAPTSR